MKLGVTVVMFSFANCLFELHMKLFLPLCLLFIAYYELKFIQKLILWNFCVIFHTYWGGNLAENSVFMFNSSSHK